MSNLLDRFNKEVLEKGPEACLPVNLSDEWLDILEECLAKILDEEIVEYNAKEDFYVSIVLSAIFKIFGAKEPKNKRRIELSVTPEELFGYFEDYRIEIAIEHISRKTEMKGNPVTIKTIFTDRKIEFSQV